jgi:hypothetical protein
MKSLVFSFLSLVFALQCACAQVPTKLKYVVLEIDGITYGDGVKQTFNPNGVSSGLNVGSHTADPSTAVNGDIWYNSTTNAMRARINNVTVSIGAGGGGGDTTSINGVTLSGLATGILKNTTGTGAPSIASAGDFPQLNQNTTGSASKLTTARNINGVAFDGTSDITVVPGNLHLNSGDITGKHAGTTINGIGGDALVFGDLVTLSSINSRWRLVNVTAPASTAGDPRGFLGIAVTNSSDGATVTILVNGLIRADTNFPAMTVGAPVYLTAGGNLTQIRPTAPNSVIRIVGHAVTASEIFFQPDNTWIKLN